MGTHTNNGARIVLAIIILLGIAVAWNFLRPAPEQKPTEPPRSSELRDVDRAERVAVSDINQDRPDQVIQEPLPESDPPPALVRSGGFYANKAKQARGLAEIYKMPGGAFILRLQGINIAPTEGLRLYVSNDSSETELKATREGMTEIAALRGNAGSQNYLLPDNLKPEDWRAVVIGKPQTNEVWATAVLKQASDNAE